MEIINRFGKGLHTDFDPQDQPQDTYRNAVNVVRDLNGTLLAEDGTQIDTILPSGMNIIGSTILNQTKILFLCDSTNTYSEIGISRNGVYTSVITNLVSPYNTSSTVLTSGLNFSMQHLIRAEARLDYRDHALVYFVDGKNVARVLDLDDVPSVNTIDAINAFLTSTMPDVKVSAVTEEGSLPTGVYQFAVRLLTSSGNKTTASIITNLIPIGDGQRSGSSTKYDGAPPQQSSNKAITIQVDNIDPKYKFIECIAITYLGQSNQFTANIIETKNIVGSSVSFNYASVSQNKDAVELLELTVDPVTYDTPKTIAQKDNRLLYGNVQARKFSADFQKVANSVMLKYVIKELSHSQDINIQTANHGEGIDLGQGSTEYNNYKDPLNVSNYTGYQRDEVYSFALVPIFKDFSFGYAYHIPGVHSWQQSAEPGTKTLGTFVSQDHAYPTGFGFPTGPVRYHRMPDMGQEPIFNHDTQKIRVLGVEALNIDLTVLSAQDRSSIIGFALTRELRTEENKSILAQGIMNAMMNSQLDAVSENPNLLLVAPWAGKSSWNWTGTSYYYNMGAFYSPETTILDKALGAASHIKQIASMTGLNYVVGDRRASGDPLEYIFADYNKFWPHGSNDSSYPKIPLTSGMTTTIRPESGEVHVTGLSPALNTVESNGYVFMKTQSGEIPIFENASTRDKVAGNAEVTYNFQEGTDMLRVWWPDGSPVVASIDDTDFRGKTLRALINVIVDRANQYGPVLDKEYILIGYKYITQDVESIQCYGGDTYINKTAILTTCSNTNSFKFDFKTLNYFWCESSANVAYRHHHVVAGAAQDLPYYPDEPNLYKVDGSGLMQVWSGYGHANGYNRQYDFENTLRKFFSKPLLLEEEVTNFSNRVIYSEQAVEGEQFDAYRQFLTNNYHDVPKNKGEITDLFVFNNSLYIHTAKTLYKALMNEQTTVVSSSGEMVLGNGGLFPMPSKEVFTIAGGYAGTTTPQASCNTSFGRYFIDNYQGKVFVLGEGLTEISAQGLSKYLRELIQPGEYYCSAYDYSLKRWILSSPRGTVSYSTNLQSWSSFHSWHASHMFSMNDKVYMSQHNNDDLWSLDNKDNHGSYFRDIRVPMVLGIVANQGIQVTKAFDDLILYTSCNSFDGTTKPWVTFSSFKAWNRVQNTGERTIFVPQTFTDNVRPVSLAEVKVNMKNNEFRLAMPQDLVIDPTGDVHSSVNLTTDAMFRPRLKGKHVEMEFRYNHTEPSSVFKVYGITTIIRPVSG